jgi:hypothetical protein
VTGTPIQQAYLNTGGSSDLPKSKPIEVISDAPFRALADNALVTTVNFTAHGINFALHLVSVEYGPIGDAVQFFSGSIVGEVGSVARFTISSSTVVGTIEGATGIFAVESTPDTSYTVMITHEVAQRFYDNTPIAANAHTKHDHEIREQHVDDASLSLSAEPRQHTMEAAGEQPPARARRAGPISEQHRACSIYLDVHESFYFRWAGTGDANTKMDRVMTKVLGTVFEVDDLYKRELGVRLAIAGVRVLTDDGQQQFHEGPNINSAQSGGDLLGEYEMWLADGAKATEGPAGSPRGADQPTSQEVCANFLFIHHPLGSTAGTANLASANSGIVGGICEDYLWKGAKGYHALNTGFANTYIGRSMDFWELVTTTSHELGHMFGAQHECNPAVEVCYSGVEKCTEDDSGGFIMYPKLVRGSNAKKFSSCTKKTVASIINAKGHCLGKFDSVFTGAMSTKFVVGKDGTDVNVQEPPAVAVAPVLVLPSVPVPAPASAPTATSGDICGYAAWEKTAVNLKCPTGKVIGEITFASFGVPALEKKKCQSAQVGECHADVSVARVEKLCIGKSACTVVAETVNFLDFDPCPGANKKLAIKANCVADDVPLIEVLVVLTTTATATITTTTTTTSASSTSTTPDLQSIQAMHVKYKVSLGGTVSAKYRFSTAFVNTAALWTLDTIGQILEVGGRTVLQVCQDKCASDMECLGIFHWTSRTKGEKCRGLRTLGAPGGSRTSVKRHTSYTKIISVIDTEKRGVDPNTYAPITTTTITTATTVAPVAEDHILKQMFNLRWAPGSHRQFFTTGKKWKLFEVIGNVSTTARHCAHNCSVTPGCKGFTFKMVDLRPVCRGLSKLGKAKGRKETLDVSSSYELKNQFK